MTKFISVYGKRRRNPPPTEKSTRMVRYSEGVLSLEEPQLSIVYRT